MTSNVAGSPSGTPSPPKPVLHAEHRAWRQRSAASPLRSTARPPGSRMRMVMSAFERARRRRQLRQGHGDRRHGPWRRSAAGRSIAVAHRLDGLVAEAEGIVLPGRERLVVGRDGDIALEVELGARRAEEIARRRPSSWRRLPGGSAMLSAVEGRTRCGRGRSPRRGSWSRRPAGPWVRIGLDAPGAAGAPEQMSGDVERAARPRPGRSATARRIFDAVGALARRAVSGRIGNRAAPCVAQEHGRHAPSRRER